MERNWKARKTTPSLKEEESPLRGILCLKTRQDMKRFEETEDCFILDFDPFDSFDVKRLTFSDDKDLTIIHETGQVACRDYPHPRHLCLNFPFGSTPNATYCNLCYCYVCDKPAPCAQWMSSHCNASAGSMERTLLIRSESSYYDSEANLPTYTESSQNYRVATTNDNVGQTEMKPISNSPPNKPLMLRSSAQDQNRAHAGQIVCRTEYKIKTTNRFESLGTCSDSS